MSERPWVRVPDGPRFFFPCDIWWLTVDLWLGQRVSKSACLVVPPLFRADSRTNLMTNLITQGENSKDDQVAHSYSWQSARKVSEQPWIRGPVGPRFFLPCECGFAARATSIKAFMSRCSSVIPSRFGDESYLAGENVKVQVAPLPSWQSARPVSERPSVRVPVGPHFFLPSDI